MDRLTNHARPIDQIGRGIDAQRQSLKTIHQLLKAGWGLFLGRLEDQQQELQGTLKFESVKVRFYGDAISLILEGERRHPSQKIRSGRTDEVTGQPAYVEYQVKLPPRSLGEFGWWLNRYMENVRVVAPISLVEQHQRRAEQLAQRYHEAL